MANEKQVSKKDIKELLDSQTEAILSVVDKRTTNQTKVILSLVEEKNEELARMLNSGFQATQDLFVDKFDQIDKNIKEIHKEVQKINLNLVDVVRKEDFDTLETRVVTLEEKAQAPVK